MGGVARYTIDRIWIAIIIINKKEVCMKYLKPVFVVLFVFCLNLYPGVIKDDFRVNDDTTGGSNYDPTVEVLSNGDAFVVWEDGRNGARNIYGQLYDTDGNTVGSNLKVSTLVAYSNEYDPAMDIYGDSILVVFEYGYCQWFLSDGSQQGLSFSLYSGSTWEPDVAVSDSGIFVVWEYSVSGSGREIFLKRFNLDGDSLGPRLVVNDDGTSNNQYRPKIAMDVSGNFVVVWRDYRSSSDYDIYGQLFDASGSKVGSNFLVNDDGISSSQYDPSCAMDSAGNFVVVWEDNRNGNYDIYGQRFDENGDTTGLGGNFLINDDVGSSYQYDPSVSMDNSGNFTVVWRDYRDGNYDIYGQLYDNTGSPSGSNFRIDQGIGAVSYDPDVSMDDNYFVVVWDDARCNRSIYKRRYNHNGTPVGNEVMVNDIDGTKNQEYPAIDMNTSGNGVITWSDYRSGSGIYFQMMDSNGDTTGINRRINYGYTPDVSVFRDGSFIITYRYSNIIYCQMYYPTGDTSGGLIAVNDTTGGNRYDPTIDIDTTGNFIITWFDYRNGNSDIYAQRFNSVGDTTGVNFRVDDDPGTFTQEYSDVAINKSGRFLIVWNDHRNGNSDIFGQVYAADGSPVGSNLLINDDIVTSNQYRSCVSALMDGNFIVAWDDYRTPRGIYGQVIDTLGNLVDPNFQIADGICYYPAVDVSPDSGFVVVWYKDVSYDIYAQRFNADCTPDSTTYKVNNDTEGPNPIQYEPDVATDGTNIIFTWRDAKWQLGYDIAAKVVTYDFTSIDEKEIDLKPSLYSIPNLFRWSTTIRYAIEKTKDVSIRIYDCCGREIKNLVEKRQNPGVYSIKWDGRDNYNKKVSGGIYFCRMKAGERTESIKMVYMR